MIPAEIRNAIWDVCEGVRGEYPGHFPVVKQSEAVQSWLDSLAEELISSEALDAESGWRYVAGGSVTFRNDQGQQQTLRGGTWHFNPDDAHYLLSVYLRAVPNIDPQVAIEALPPAHWRIDLPAVHTMQDLRALIRLLSGAP